MFKQKIQLIKRHVWVGCRFLNSTRIRTPTGKKLEENRKKHLKYNVYFTAKAQCSVSSRFGRFRALAVTYIFTKMFVFLVFYIYIYIV